MVLRPLLKPILSPLMRGPTEAPGGGGGGPVNLHDGLYDVWEFDENGLTVGAGNAVGVLAPSFPADLRWAANNNLADIAGLLNEGAFLGAVDATSTSGANRGYGGSNMAAANQRSLFSPAGSFTLTEWVYPTVNPGAGSYDTIWNIGPHSGSVFGWGILHMGAASASATLARFEVRHSATYSARDLVDANTNLTLNAWNLIAVGRDADNALIGVSVNGEEWKTVASNGPPLAATSDLPTLWAQGSGLGNFKWSGRQDQMGYWHTRFLNNAELAHLYNGGAGRPYSAF